jgi:hypothetical protein
MDKTEFDLLKKTNCDEIITADDLKNKSDRTLLYGYTCERHTFHVYIKDKEIHVIIYDNDYTGENKVKNVREFIPKGNRDFVPDKRLYPEACDYEFCSILRKMDIDLPFTFWNDNREPNQFYGYTL